MLIFKNTHTKYIYKNEYIYLFYLKQLKDIASYYIYNPNLTKLNPIPSPAP